MRYVVTVFRESSFKPEVECVGDNYELMIKVCQRYRADSNDMAHSIFVYDWHELSLSEFVISGPCAGLLMTVSN